MSAHEFAVLHEQREADARVLTEALESGHRVTIEGGTPDARSKVAHAIRNALQILHSTGVDAGATVANERVIAYGDTDLSSVEQLLHTALEADACREATTADITVYDDVTVQRLVDELDEKPHRFAVRYIAAIERLHQLEQRIDRELAVR